VEGTLIADMISNVNAISIRTKRIDSIGVTPYLSLGSAR
jgi:hypothetical protein